MSDTHLFQEEEFPQCQPDSRESKNWNMLRSARARQLVGTRGSSPPSPFSPRWAAAASEQPLLHPWASLSRLGRCQAQLLGSGCCCSSRWHGHCRAGPGRAIMTHPIGIRTLHWLFIGPCRPQKALGLSFSPSLPPSRSLALAWHRRGSERNAVDKPVGPSATFSSTAKFLPLCCRNHPGGFSLNKLLPAHQPFPLAFFPPSFSAWISSSFCFFFSPLPSLSLRSFTLQFLALAWLFLGRAGESPERGGDLPAGLGKFPRLLPSTSPCVSSQYPG